MKEILTLIMCLFAFGVQSQKKLIPYRKGDLWGYSSQYREIKITPKYEFAGLFKRLMTNNGKVKTLARVKLNGKWGVLNQKEEVVVKIVYDSVVVHWGRWIEAWQDGKRVDFDAQGQRAQKKKLRDLSDIINSDILYYGFVPKENEGKWGLMDKSSGKMVIDFIYDKMSKFDARREIIKALKNGKWRYVNTAGKEFFEL